MCYRNKTKIEIRPTSTGKTTQMVIALPRLIDNKASESTLHCYLEIHFTTFFKAAAIPAVKSTTF